MNFSTKIKKFYEGMRVYDSLLEDEKAIHLPFALSFTVTITTILEQLRMFLSDLANNVCREIPDIFIIEARAVLSSLERITDWKIYLMRIYRHFGRVR